MGLRIAGTAFGLIALGAGGIQLWAYAVTDWPRHLVLGVFACAVGLCVLMALGRTSLSDSRSDGVSRSRRKTEGS
ncbi:hypothetical protein C1S81_21845 [Mycolicibacterium neoaurum]|nr:hypothetical protein C1S81_21845 [Mycolicibacterium neoaurum]